MKGLEIGPGRHPIPGYDTVDVVGNPTYRATWGQGKLPIADSYYDDVFASHVLEHVPWFQTINALREVFRILKTGGTFEVWVPNVAYLVQCYLERKCGDPWRKHNPKSDPMVWFNGRLFTYGPGEENWHRAVFDQPYLIQCLNTAGFDFERKGEFLQERSRGVSHGPIEMGARITK